SRWSYGAIQYAVNKGYMNGVGEGRFDPAGQMTRGMVVTVLYRREGSPEVTFRDDFTDVKAGKYYSDAVIWAKDEGVVNGITETTFGPNGKITREQLATMLSRFSERCLVSVPERADLSGYPDADKIHSYAKDALAWANEANLIKGMSDGTLSPRGEATREQFATILMRFDETFTLRYNPPVLRNQYTEKPYPLVENADLYVAADGNDTNPGTFDAPLATFAGAAAKVREIKQTKTSGDIVVAFKAGDYGPVELELGPEDGGSENQRIIYCKYGDGDVTFDNGITLKESEFLPLDADELRLFNPLHTDKIKKIDLNPILGEVPEYEDFALFSDSGYCQISCYPNKYPDGSDHFFNAAETYDNTRFRVIHPGLARRLSVYTDEMIEGMRIYGYLYAGYRKDILEICAYDGAESLMTTTEESRNKVWGNLRANWRDADGMGIRMYVLNVSYELDNEGEYWVDRRTGTLYVFDPSGNYNIPMGHGEYRVRGVANYDTGDGYPATDGYCAIYAEDTGYITFRGLRFTNNVDEFIIGYRTSGIEIDRCRFDRCTGRNQLLFEHSLPDVPMGLRVTDSEFDLCVGRHVYIFDEADGPGRFTNRSDVFIDNCLFARANLVFDAEGALNLHRCSGGEVSHNRFENCCRYAVMFTGSCDVIVEYNDFDSAMTNSDDGGVTRGCSDVQGNNVIRYNFYNSISGGQVGRMAHYCDNYDCGTVMYSNLLFNAGGVVYHGSGRDN
ncbi:MAG: S-layer homology domain-containing protein, partial [Clostridia bacterium]|nr:S-layer homology domain-containing protein [Clostridia bacterium]